MKPWRVCWDVSFCRATHSLQTERLVYLVWNILWSSGTRAHLCTHVRVNEWNENWFRKIFSSTFLPSAPINNIIRACTLYTCKVGNVVDYVIDDSDRVLCARIIKKHKKKKCIMFLKQWEITRYTLFLYTDIRRPDDFQGFIIIILIIKKKKYFVFSHLYYIISYKHASIVVELS